MKTNNFSKNKNNTNTSCDEGKGNSVRHIHTYVAIFEHGDDAQRKELWDALTCNINKSNTEDEKAEKEESNKTKFTLVRQLMQRNSTIPILIAAAKYYDPCRSILYK